MNTKMNLQDFFKQHTETAIAFSGGVDSSYLLYTALKYGIRARAYYVKSAFQPHFELDDAVKLANVLGADMRILDADILADERISSNPENRCYYCKHLIFSLIMDAARKDGFKVLLDGTNASDNASDRPGMKALQELKVLSPLRECGLTKDLIRQASQEAGLFTWNKPAYACLATRISTGEEITKEKLQNIEAAESCLSSLGFTDFRVRTCAGRARLQIKAEQKDKAAAQWKQVRRELLKYFSDAEMDPEPR